MNPTEVFVDLNPITMVVELYIKSGEAWVVEPVYRNVLEGEKPPVAMRLDVLEAQALMDRLWKAGLRPTEGAGSAGALAATQHHLKDMRTLVFDRREPKTSKDLFSPEVYRKFISE